MNRIQKVLEGANIKLTSVINDIDGKSSRNMLSLMINGCDDPVLIANKARRQMRKKILQIQEAVKGISGIGTRLALLFDLFS